MTDRVEALFADTGAEGFYFDIQNLDTLFTDTARTTAAAVGDAVRGITDLSGNGNHMSKSTKAPTLRQNAETDAYYLEFAGGSGDGGLDIGSTAFFQSVTVSYAVAHALEYPIDSNARLLGTGTGPEYIGQIHEDGVNGSMTMADGLTGAASPSAYLDGVEFDSISQSGTTPDQYKFDTRDMGDFSSAAVASHTMSFVGFDCDASWDGVTFGPTAQAQRIVGAVYAIAAMAATWTTAQRRMVEAQLRAKKFPLRWYIRQPTARRIVLVEIEYPVTGLGTDVWLYASTADYATRPYDSLANVAYSAVISGVPSFGLSISPDTPLEPRASASFGSLRTTTHNVNAVSGGVAVTSFKLSNLGRGGDVRVLLAGPPELYGYDDAILLFVCGGDGVEHGDDGSVTVSLADVTRRIYTNDFLVSQRVYGDAYNITPTLDDYGSQGYRFDSAECLSVEQVWDQGVRLNADAQTPAALAYDGSSSRYQSWAATQTGLADGKEGTFCCAVQMYDAAGDQKLLQNTSADSANRFQIWLRGGIVEIEGETSAPATTLLIRSRVAVPADGAYHHIAASWDLAATTAHIYIDGVEALADDAARVISDATIDYERASTWQIGRAFFGALAEIYFDTSYNDFSNSAVLDTVVDFRGRAIYLGATGADLSGSQPLCYAPDGDLTANLGSSDNWSQNGAKTSAPDAPPTDAQVTDDAINGRFNLAQQPFGRVTAHVKGRVSGSPSELIESVADIADDIVSLTDTGIDSIECDVTDAVSLYVQTPTPLRDVLDTLCRGITAFWYVDFGNVLRIREWDTPGIVYAHTYPREQIISWNRRRKSWPGWRRVQQYYDKNWTPFEDWLDGADAADTAWFADDGVTEGVVWSVFDAQPDIIDRGLRLDHGSASNLSYLRAYDVSNAEWVTTVVVPYVADHKLGDFLKVIIDVDSTRFGFFEFSGILIGHALQIDDGVPLQTLTIMSTG